MAIQKLEPIQKKRIANNITPVTLKTNKHMYL